MPATPPILIAGGGIGGLAAALALSQAGRAVQVIERTAGGNEAGAGIQLGPNAVKVLRGLGIADAVQAVASIPEALVVRAGATGQILSQMQLGSQIERRHGAPYWVVHRADLHRVLIEACSASPLITQSAGRTVETVAAMGAAGVTVSCSDGTQLAGMALIGADGLWSRARTYVDPRLQLKPSGYCAFRALLPVARAGILASPVVGAWLSARAHVVHYPVRGGREINVVVISRDEAVLDVWSAGARPTEVTAAVADFAPDMARALGAVTGWQKWSLAEPVTLKNWTRGPVALLGDAAHAMLPFFAQGGAMALEDAAVLAQCVAASCQDLPEAFEQYAKARQTRVARVQAASSANGRIFHMSGPAALARDTALRLMPQALLQARFDWLYGYDACASRSDRGHTGAVNA